MAKAVSQGRITGTHAGHGGSSRHPRKRQTGQADLHTANSAPYGRTEVCCGARNLRAALTTDSRPRKLHFAPFGALRPTCAHLLLVLSPAHPLCWAAPGPLTTAATPFCSLYPPPAALANVPSAPTKGCGSSTVGHGGSACPTNGLSFLAVGAAISRPCNSAVSAGTVVFGGGPSREAGPYRCGALFGRLIAAPTSTIRGVSETAGTAAPAVYIMSERLAARNRSWQRAFILTPLLRRCSPGRFRFRQTALPAG